MVTDTYKHIPQRDSKWAFIVGRQHFIHFDALVSRKLNTSLVTSNFARALYPYLSIHPCNDPAPHARLRLHRLHSWKEFQNSKLAVAAINGPLTMLTRSLALVLGGSRHVDAARPGGVAERIVKGRIALREAEAAHPLHLHQHPVTHTL